VQITLFRSIRDRDAIERSYEWHEIAARGLQPQEYPGKDSMPLIKLGRFGEHRSRGGFIRHEENVVAISGVEGDYDGGQMDIADAVTAIGMAEITALLYTTPSHTPERPRWRVLAPLSREYPPADRARFVARINGLLGGALAPESFTIAQTFYWGRVRGAPWAAHQTVGRFIDLADDLDGQAIGPPVRPRAAPAPAGAAPGTFAEGGRNRGLFELACSLRRGRASPDEIEAALMVANARRCVPPLPDDDVRTIARSAGRYPEGPAPVVRRDFTAPDADGQVFEVAAAPAAAPRAAMVADGPPVIGEVEGAAPVGDDAGILNEYAAINRPSSGGYLIPPRFVSAAPAHWPDYRIGPMVCDMRGEHLANVASNALHIARMRWGALVWKDAFTGYRMLGTRPLISETDGMRLAAHVNQTPGGSKITWQMMSKALDVVADDCVVDPIREWLESLAWDGTPRLDHMAEDIFGVTGVGEDQLERLILRKLMIASVARQFRPGAKFDVMVVLEGRQGTRKSTAIRTLFGEAYTASFDADMQSKDFKMLLGGHLAVEIAELASLDKSHQNVVKSLLSETTDVFRPPYGRHVERRARRCVIIGSTNDPEYLVDLTGNRRYWPLRCGMVDTDLLLEQRDQLWAEAVAAFRAGESWHEVPGRVVEEQEERTAADPWDAVLEGWLVGRAGPVKMADVLTDALQIPVERQGMATQKRAGGALRRAGWRKGGGGRQGGKVWVHPDRHP
jgi:hypothetical protein